MPDRRDFITGAALSGMALGLPSPVRAAPQADDDVALLGDILRSLHPGLHRYLSPRAFEAGLSRLGRTWAANLRLDARYLALSRFLATIRCGHSYANFFNQQSKIATQLFDRKTRLPFAFRWIDEQMVVLQDQSGSGLLPAGTLIKSVNQVSARAILARLMPYVRADGGNDAKRRALLSISGADQFETFDVFHGLVFGTPASDFHQLTIRRPGETHESIVELPALTLTQRQSFNKSADRSDDRPVWGWEMTIDGIAVLTMDSWGLYDSKWDWRSWLNDRLSALGGAKGLIVDLRANEGGNNCGDALLARLSTRDIVPPAVDRLVRYRQVPERLDHLLDTWDPSFRNWGAAAKPFNQRYLQLDEMDEGGPIAPRGVRVTVPVVVLTGPQNSSATFRFANLVKASGLAKLIGETTGGNRRGINGGAFFFARLPESGLEFDVPLIGYFPRLTQPDAGIEPDLKVANSAADIAAGRDSVMAIARAEILAS